jgi:hypothetical protein
MGLGNMQKLAEIHVQGARQYALRLFAFVSTVFPSEWGQTWNELIAPDLLEFAFHARKVNELCGLKDESFPDVDSLIVHISENNPEGWETNYQYALNAFVHMKSFMLGHAHADHRRVFEKSEANLQATYVRIQTDKFAEKTISISGLVFCFLNNVIPVIRKKYPEMRF